MARGRHVPHGRRPQGDRTERGNRGAPDGYGPTGPTRLLLTKPVVAAVAGHAGAGGLELAMEDTSVKIDTATRDRFKALAAARGMTMRD